MTASPTIIIGGGIAGLGLAWALTECGADETVIVVESEPLTFSHSSGRNAAILRPLEHSIATTLLAQRSVGPLGSINPKHSLVDPCGLLLSADADDELHSSLRIAHECGIRHEVLDRGQLERRCPWLAGGTSTCGIWLPDGGVIDIHGLGEQLRLRAAAGGAAIRTGLTIQRVTTSGERVTGVVTTTGERLSAERVVIAAGAWSAELGVSCDCPLPLVPYRRHLAQLAPQSPVAEQAAVSWSLSSGMYVRREGAGVLACPGDHTADKPGLPPVDPAMVERLAQTLPDFAPALSEAQLHRAWACLRTMSADCEAVIGADSRVEGLFWLTGLGGFGMTAGLGAAQLLADVMQGATDELATHFAPKRFLIT